MQHSVEIQGGDREARYRIIGEIAQRLAVADFTEWPASILDVIEDDRVSSVQITESVIRGRTFRVRAFLFQSSQEEAETDDHPSFEEWTIKDEDEF